MNPSAESVLPRKITPEERKKKENLFLRSSRSPRACVRVQRFKPRRFAVRKISPPSKAELADKDECERGKTDQGMKEVG